MTEGPLDVFQLANQLRPVLLKLGRRLRSETQAEGVSSVQITLLMVMQKNPHYTAADLAASEGISGPTLMGHLNKLEGQNLIERIKPATGDRRRTELHLTEKGQKFIEEVREKRALWLAERLKQLDKAQQQAILQAIEPLQHLLEAKT
ncbi:MarR family winged helix-turn-helix transcriptional regulator [Deinococcus roseus]|uniref:MarR family transcriptional regulator n=1 Tax=Deinococcus roseus TaxID=392414 RepID=A0ABQ2CWR3_9DEIO|nr:MarR family transcriptional regulator [Deinococcus roseus]GGJ28452.1 MarR family transcriptional regulator [Deinococcus roseus]